MKEILGILPIVLWLLGLLLFFSWYIWKNRKFLKDHNNSK